MAKTIGARAVRQPRQVVAKLTFGDIEELRQQGHVVTTRPDGSVEVGGAVFQVMRQQPALAPSVSVVEADPLHGVDVSGTGRNQLTDFG